MTTQSEFIQQHSDNGTLTADQAAQLLELDYEGDTGDTPETGGEPDATAETAKAPEGNEEAGKTEPELTAENAVILAKDGKHTIDYQKLVDARQAEQSWKAQAAAAQEELETFKAEALARAEAGEAPTKTDQHVAAANAAIEAGFDPGIFGDFTEEDLAKGVQTLVDQRVAAAVAAQLDTRLQPLKQQQDVSAAETHFQTIYEKHPDADSILESKELDDWINAQPSFARAGYKSALTEGSAEQVVEIFDAFKGAAGQAQATTADASADAKAAAKAAIAKSQPQAPASLSDIPGSTAGPANRAEAIASMSPTDMTEAMANMSPEQIEDFLSRSL